MTRACRRAAAPLVLAALAAAPAIAASPQGGNHGAIVFNAKTGAWGYAVDRPTSRAAAIEAERQCGEGCDVAKTFRSGCAALAARNGRYAIEIAPTRTAAEHRALERCKADCQILIWACTR
jgi:hypothetical protein